MSNPYQPPGAEVADPQMPRSPVPAPVRIACLLILAGMGLSLLTLIPGVRAVDPALPQVSFWVEALWVGFFVALTVWLLVKIQRRKNWARWTMLLLLAIGWIAIASDLPEGLTRSPIAAVADMIVTGLELAAVWRLFLGPAAAWFGPDG